jgi:hypothetical protein
MTGLPDDAVRELASWRNADGGWGYGPGRATRVEPTCLAVLALGTRLAPGGAQRALAALGVRDGLFVEDGLPPNFTANGLALVTLLSAGPPAPAHAAGLASALTAARGLTFDPSPDLAHDTRLAAWPWVAGSFSWVEPTAWCTLALKRHRRVTPGGADPRAFDAVTARLDEAERVLRDRAIAGGGWNYGNTRVLGSSLPAYVPTTALALLALQDHPDDPVVAAGAAWLVGHLESEPSALALGLSALALHVVRGPAAAGPLDAQIAAQLPAAIELRQLPGLAVGLFALDRHVHDCAPLRV